MAYKIKQIPEDFLVSEVIDVFIGKGGKYACYSLWKNNVTTERAISAIAYSLKKSRKYINYSGTKDKFAVTEQYISILNGPNKNLDLNNIKLTYLGRVDERMNLSTHVANDFEITVRAIDEIKTPKKMKWVPNYFDEQRFGREANNHFIGKLIVQKKFKEAARMIPECLEHLRNHHNDAIGALRIIPKRTLWLYVHAYQSFLWNRMVSEYMKKFKHKKLKYPLGELIFPTENVKNINVPLIGYETKIPNDIAFIANEIMSSEGVKKEDFKIPEMPEMVSSGADRNLMMPLEEFSITSLEKDELNKGKRKCVVSFRLPKGAYATMAIKALFN
ncbi:MAG: tRNA pseudouridine(13) synthase TruD [Nanoarchaeota archaeon]